MKKITLLVMALCLSLATMAQQKRLEVPASLQYHRAIAPVSVKDNTFPEKPVNPTAVSKSALEDIIGSTIYDEQTNASPSNHFYIFDDGTMAGVWTMGSTNTSSAERGTGYNYYSSTWGPAPTVRIETLKTGWPSIAPLGATGEIIVAHTSSSGLTVNKRAVKGSGAWTQTILPGPANAIDIGWPRVMTSGVNHNSVHIIANIDPATHPNLYSANLYFRSLDGGVTWDKQNVILPGIDSLSCLGFAADEYAWASPKGDTIAFALAGQWVDGIIMKSFDNGNTWTKTVFFNNPYKLTPNTTVVDRFPTLDGSVAIELDHAGKAHIAVGRMYADCDGAKYQYYPGTDGLIYWNENMPVLDTTRVGNFDALLAHGQLLGFVTDNSAGDSIVGFPYYGVALSSLPQISIDNNHNIYVIWSGLTVGNPSPDNLNYRHIWARTFNAAHASWDNMVDLNSDFLYIFKEFVYPSMNKKIRNNNLEYIYQTADVPGSAVINKPLPIAVHNNDIEYRSLGIWVGLNNQGLQKNAVSQNYPNPVQNMTHFRLTLANPASVNISVSNITGTSVMEMNKGFITSGNHDVTLDARSLSPGIYFYTVTMGSEKITKKMFVL